MTPKFRGDSDDWLDDEDSSTSGARGTAPGRARKGDAKIIPASQANAVVAEVYPNQCRVRLYPEARPDESTDEITCSYRRAGVISNTGGAGKAGTKERSPVAVGDRVKVAINADGSGVVKGVCERRNYLARPAPGRDVKNVHVIASNLDVLVIVASVSKPEFSPGLIDRYLVAAGAAGIEPLLCVSKIDLFEQAERPWDIYRKIGIRTMETCAKSGIGVPELSRALAGKAVAFCGHSGVGKTSLLRALLGTAVGKVGELSESTGKGRHTTTGAVLLHGPEKSEWIDTPGVREFGLSSVKAEELARYFPEFLQLECARSGCLHADEEGCQATELPRYTSYRRIFDSLKAGEN